LVTDNIYPIWQRIRQYTNWQGCVNWRSKVRKIFNLEYFKKNNFNLKPAAGTIRLKTISSFQHTSCASCPLLCNSNVCLLFNGLTSICFRMNFYRQICNNLFCIIIVFVGCYRHWDLWKFQNWNWWTIWWWDLYIFMIIMIERRLNIRYFKIWKIIQIWDEKSISVRKPGGQLGKNEREFDCWILCAKKSQNLDVFHYLS
jgi:hypothetical protein